MDALTFDIKKADVDSPEVAALIARHFALMRAQSPPESCHVMTAQGLVAAGAKLLVLCEGDTTLAIGGLAIEGSEGELKSMHTVEEVRGRGAGRALLRALIDLARADGVTRINLETGSAEAFKAARRLYRSEGFVECPPFGSYTHDPLSVFMTCEI